MSQPRTVNRVELREITGDRDLYRPIPLAHVDLDMDQDRLHDAIDAVPGAATCELALGLLRCACENSETLTVLPSGGVVWNYMGDHYHLVFFGYDDLRAIGRSFEVAQARRGKTVGIADLGAQPRESKSYRIKLGAIGRRKRHPDADAMERLVMDARRVQWKHRIHDLQETCIRRAWRQGLAFHDDELATYLAA